MINDLWKMEVQIYWKLGFEWEWKKGQTSTEDNVAQSFRLRVFLRIRTAYVSSPEFFQNSKLPYVISSVSVMSHSEGILRTLLTQNIT